MRRQPVRWSAQSMKRLIMRLGSRAVADDVGRRISAERFPPPNLRKLKRHRAAALHDLAERVGCNASRQRRGVRQPYAALVAPIGDRFSVRWPLAARRWSFDSPSIGGNNLLVYVRSCDWDLFL